MVCVRLFHSPVVSDATKVAKASLSVFLSRSNILPLSLSRGRTNLLTARGYHPHSELREYRRGQQRPLQDMHCS